MLARDLYWTGGHPFLTLRLVKEAREAPLTKLPVFLELAGRRAVVAGGTLRRWRRAACPVPRSQSWQRATMPKRHRSLPSRVPPACR